MRSCDTLLKIEGLEVRLPEGGDRPNAVEDFHLSLGRGEIVCVVGESGSGKSLMAQAVMGILPSNLPSPRGAVMFEDRNLLTLPDKERLDISGRRIAMIFQEPSAALNPIFRVGDQVAEVFRLHTGLSHNEARRRVVSLFSEVRLPDPEKIYQNYPHQLSGGQCQRVMIATGLALEPAILIADEPTTALDVTTQAQILKLMLDLRERHGTGILFITHDFGVVADIADRVAVMQHGRLVEVGTKDEVLRRPKAGYTRSLIKAVPKLQPREQNPHLGDWLVRAKGIVKTFDLTSIFQRGRSVTAVDKVSLEIRRGETLGLVGESGSGKSTFAQCIIRLVDPDEGLIELGDMTFSDLRGAALRKARSRVQIVFQDPYTALDPRQKVVDAIAEGPIIHGVSKGVALKDAKELLRSVGLDANAGDRFPHEFSGGQRQRICIARALALEPQLLIADESVSALDVSVQAHILDLLERMQKERGFSMLFITHDLRVASRLCDRIAVMRHGRILEIASPAELFSSPREAYTRELLAAVPGRDWLQQLAPM
ncbi:dipeptide ABC transporter ATP-binding protein [Microvirga brassicacearum]|uniref:dipeptide ABC transporter ATP-binding protein n=1 Tax=Microvirga brassicacearum TaxID=2580413 RepID=UPI001FCE3CED|nr:ABC transporter ATP-binding protein [Microvirga brassicacearum]